MSDAALSSEQPVKRSTYDPAKDRERMKKYMALKRAKDKAGYQHLTVRQYLLIAPQEDNA